MWTVASASRPNQLFFSLARTKKLRLLRQRGAEAHALVPQFETIREASMARIEAANTLKRLTSHPQDGGFNTGA
jgi:hypothetical protein